jgi:serine phosphatase RsbU (regulator of sigma subunit)
MDPLEPTLGSSVSAAAEPRSEASDPLALLDDLLTASPAGVALFDRELRLVRANPAFEVLNGGVDARGRRLDEVFGSAAGHVVQASERVLLTGEPVHHLRITVALGDRVGHHLCTFFAVHGREEQVTGVGAIVFDVTVEHQLVAARDEAEGRADTATRSLEALRSLTATIAGTRSLDAAIDVILGVGLQAAGADAGCVALIDHDAGEALVRAAVGYEPGGWLFERPFRLDERLPLTHTARTGEAVLAHHEGLAARFPDLTPWLAAARHTSVATLALRADDRVVAVLALSFLEAQPFDDEQVAALRVVADLAAAALVRVQLLEAQEAARLVLAETAERNRFLAQATALVSAAFDEQEVLERLVRLCVPRLGDWCSITRPRDGQLERVIVHHGDPALQSHTDRLRGWAIPLDGANPVALTFRTGAPRLHPAVDQAMGVDSSIGPDQRAVLRALGSSAGITVPIGPSSRPVGVLSFAVGPGRTLTEDDATLAAEIALRAGVALSHAEDFARERDSATVLQRAVLPAGLPQVDGVLLAAAYRPAGGSRLVGGDWYDACLTGDGRVALVVGDVVGHGVGAAAAMGQLRNALRAYLFEGHAPAASLERVNRLLRADRPVRRATVVVAVYDPATGDLVLANAGHLPPLLVDGDRCDLLGGTHGPLLGAFDEPEIPERRVRLRPGTSVVLYTDGLVERRDRSLDTTIAELCDLVRNEPPTPADLDGWCRGVVRAAINDRRDDDACVLTLWVGPGQGRGDDAGR